MLTFGQAVLIAIISSGFAAAIVGSFFTYLINNRLDRHQRVISVRKEIYSNVQEELAGFFDTATTTDRQKSCSSLLTLYRQIQLWASKEVVKQFNVFWDAIDLKNAKTQEELREEYTKLVIAMREDLTGQSIDKEDVRRYGKIS